MSVRIKSNTLAALYPEIINVVPHFRLPQLNVHVNPLQITTRVYVSIPSSR